eukprot:CAMPEP_0184492350 /NCGR_PEP_ID=MMETSP0113_2-20130426/22959_1 /TAXON_ID=91329 /ORGANISM="Norrisiella sphaerica, Strain BC52" /LENGTH=214 /DNA_ID=CAMNT_0026877091 /DNA_START=68 /DNA_END=709 /DNA_ORIENTATION=-
MTHSSDKSEVRSSRPRANAFDIPLRTPKPSVPDKKSDQQPSQRRPQITQSSGLKASDSNAKKRKLTSRRCGSASAELSKLSPARSSTEWKRDEERLVPGTSGVEDREWLPQKVRTARSSEGKGGHRSHHFEENEEGDGNSGQKNNPPGVVNARDESEVKGRERDENDFSSSSFDEEPYEDLAVEPSLRSPLPLFHHATRRSYLDLDYRNFRARY